MVRERVTWPAASRPTGGGLLSLARRLPTGWERGVTFVSRGCTPFQVWPTCPPIDGSEQVKTPSERSETWAEFDPFVTTVPEVCSTLSTTAEELGAEAAETLQQVRSAAADDALFLGVGDNPTIPGQ